MMFAGTTVSNGAAVGVVTATGMRTEIGKIQANVQEAKEDEEKTPLGQKIDAFGALLARDRTWENGLRCHASHRIPRVSSHPSPPLRHLTSTGAYLCGLRVAAFEVLPQVVPSTRHRSSHGLLQRCASMRRG